jgi:hypothetical protein
MKVSSLPRRHAAVLPMAAFAFLAGCSATGPINGSPQPIFATADYGGASFETRAPFPSPSPSPTGTPTIAPATTLLVLRTPTPAPSPTFSPFEWACMEDGSPDPCHRALLDVSMRTVDDGWIVGERGIILRWDGAHLVRMKSPDDITLRRVVSLRGDDAWAVGDHSVWSMVNGMVWESELLRWNGSVWSVFPAPKPFGSIVDLSFSSETNGWAIVAEGSSENPDYSFYRWDGKAWARFSDAPTLNGIAINAPDDGWAVGKHGVILHWDGTQWAPAESPTDKDLDKVSFFEKDSGWAASRQGVIIKFIGGKWWEYSTLAPAPRAIALDPNGGGWMLGLWQSGDVMLFWNGSDWVKYLGAFPDGEVTSIASPAPGKAWAVGWIPGRSRTGMVWHWTSRGWVRALSMRALPIRAAEIMGDNAIWAVGDNGITDFWDGASWTEIDNPTTQSLSAVRFLSPTNGWAAGEGGQIMHWDGNFWSITEPFQWRSLVDDGKYPHISDIAFPSANNGWAAGRKDGGGLLSPLLLHWDGKTWRETDLGEATLTCQCELNALHFFSAEDGWAVGGGEKALFAHWDGARWTLSTGPDNVRLLTVRGVSANDVWAAGIRTAGGSSPYPGAIMHFDGSVWSDIGAPASANWLDAMWFASSTEGWLAGDDILHWNGVFWGTVLAPIDNRIVAISRTPQGFLLAVTDNGVVLRLQAR